jgi:ankyrin repeat protein
MLAPADSPVHQELCKAASEGQHRRVEILYGSEGANIDTRDRTEMTALHHATIRGDHEMMEFLLDSGADVNSRHTLLGTPICAAALRGHLKAVEVLFKYKAGLRLTHNGAVGSAMHCACFSGDMAIVKMILKHGGDLKQASTISMLAFYDMANIDFTPSWSPFWVRRYGNRQVRCTPVLLAAERCHFALLDLCWIELGKNRPNSIPSSSTYSVDNPKWGLVAEKDVKLRYSPSVGTTVSTEASTNSTWSSFGFPRHASAPIKSTLLMWAAASLNLDLITYLLKHDARLSAQDASLRIALYYAILPFDDAAFHNIDRCVGKLAQGEISEPTTSQLLSLIVDPDHQTLDPRVTYSYGFNIQVKYISTILSYAVGISRRDAVYNALCFVLGQINYPKGAFEALCDHPCCGSPSALLWYIMKVYKPSEILVSSILNHGADPNHFSLGKSTLGIAVERGRSKAIIALLLEHGANPDVMGNNGKTPKNAAMALSLISMNELLGTHQASHPWFSVQQLQLVLPSLPFGQKRKPP